MAVAMKSGWLDSFFNASPAQKAATLLKWLGRLSALLLLLFWGAFFVEHVNEWYIQPKGQYPPFWVGLNMFFHFTMLVGLAISLRWGVLGSGVLAAGTVGFAAVLASHGKLPGLLMSINLVPICLFAAWWMLARSGRMHGRDEQSLAAKHDV